MDTTGRIIPTLSIRFSDESLRRAEAELSAIPNGLPRAINGAINKVLPKGRTEATNALANLLTAKRGNILRRITVRRSTPRTLSGSINIQQRQIALVNFSFKEKRKKKGWGTAASGTGVEVQIYKSGSTQRFPHAFVATGRRDQSDGGGNKHIFQRVSNAAGRRAPRFPIVSLKGVSLMLEFERRGDMRRRVQDKIAAETDRQLASQVDRYLQRPKQA